MGQALAPTVWIPLHSLEPAHRPAGRPGALAVLTQLQTAWDRASANEDSAGLSIAIACVNARLLHRKLATRESLAAAHEPQFAAYCRMLAAVLEPLLTMLEPAVPSVADARLTLAAARIQVEAMAAVAGSTDAGAPAVFDELLNQLEATDLFLLTA
jgi:hypothetical protein